MHGCWISCIDFKPYLAPFHYACTAHLGTPADETGRGRWCRNRHLHHVLHGGQCGGQEAVQLRAWPAQTIAAAQVVVDQVHETLKATAVVVVACVHFLDRVHLLDRDCVHVTIMCTNTLYAVRYTVYAIRCGLLVKDGFYGSAGHQDGAGVA